MRLSVRISHSYLIKEVLFVRIFLKNVLFNGVYNKIEVFRLFFSIACMILHDYDDIVRRDIDECYGNNGGNFFSQSVHP